MADNQKILDPQKCMEIGRSCACYNLRRAARATTRLYDDCLKPSGLRTTQYSVLMAAKLRGPITLTKLAQITVTERTTLTRNLTVLEKKGLVLIEAGKDRRERRVSITEQGEEALIAAIPLWEAAQAHIEQGLGRQRVGALLGDLSAIISISRTPSCPPWRPGKP
ncbi:MAG: MarR family winged helix-turn-helix transcriptional regulator [Syntrophobacteraceae bacterium]|nr:MarR family winged helix-turn-helix transcriptional regulator [Syntrophobacteraceae bacterium]